MREIERPAVLGAHPRFPDGVPLARPAAPPLERVFARLRPSYDRGVLTNGPLVAELEDRAAERLGVANVVAVSCCTSGLLLTFQALGLDGSVVVPSFTFSASAHALVWNRLEPTFVECLPDSFQVDPDDVEGVVAEGAAGVLATHVFGSPCDVEVLEAIASAAGIPLVLDAAHGLGALRRGRPVGSFGRAEIFSLSPTKPVVAGEGGLVATNDRDLAETLRLGRDYGNPGDYDTRFAGLNARMSEMHAAIALESLAALDETLERRRAVARRYADGLADIPGLALQRVDPEDESTWKDLTVAIDAETFGIERDLVARALAADGVDTRRYFWPPVHRQETYAGLAPRPLPVTDRVAGSVLSLPMYADLPLSTVDAVVECLRALHTHAEAVSSQLASSQAWNISTAHSA